MGKLYSDWQVYHQGEKNILAPNKSVHLFICINNFVNWYVLAIILSLFLFFLCNFFSYFRFVQTPRSIQVQGPKNSQYSIDFLWSLP